MQRDLLRKVVEEYIRDEQPDLMEEFAVSFDDVADSIERGVESTQRVPGAPLGFDSTVLTGTVIAAAGWVAAKFLEAAFKDSIRRDLLPRLDAMEQLLGERGGDRKMVKGIRERVESVLKKMAGS